MIPYRMKIYRDTEMQPQPLTIVGNDRRPPGFSLFSDEKQKLFLVYKRQAELPIFYLYKNERLAQAKVRQLNERADAVVWFLKPIEIEDE